MKNNGEVEYLVKWEDYPEEENEWVPLANLADPEAPEVFAMLREFEDGLLVRGGRTRGGRERRPNVTLRDFV